MYIVYKLAQTCHQCLPQWAWYETWTLDFGLGYGLDYELILALNLVLMLSLSVYMSFGHKAFCAM